MSLWYALNMLNGGNMPDKIEEKKKAARELAPLAVALNKKIREIIIDRGIIPADKIA